MNWDRNVLLGHTKMIRVLRKTSASHVHLRSCHIGQFTYMSMVSIAGSCLESSAHVTNFCIDGFETLSCTLSYVKEKIKCMVCDIGVIVSLYMTLGCELVVLHTIPSMLGKVSVHA